MKNIRGVLFDKDGTLLDFNSIWLPVALDLVNILVAEYRLEEVVLIKKHLLQCLGINQGSFEADSVLIYGTSSDIAKALHKTFRKEEVQEALLAGLDIKVRCEINRLVCEKAELIRPIGKSKELLIKLKRKGIYIGVATADTAASARFCLQRLGIEDYFDFIGCDDGGSIPKPNPELLYKFCAACGLYPDEVVVIGDTETDMKFAKNGNAALAIGVLSGIASQSVLQTSADYVINSVDDILDQNDRPLWDYLE
ncbi:phosphoglycolate phosphatase [Sporomusaceae bacterium BoRhaA]|uniref:HAD family hydrolase n=1 Tax=Pelorhabdus rhamnosifermentans TaxID=2772457 RepID=UPI001C060DAC|nr:HAD family hydrolase [Pelorhabdus rhamnosifermentans]MBU2700002.1 phosphoglycolate phosphatase [Pelorhabdus rhamnosifermentans]